LEIELVGFSGKRFSVELSARLILYEGENAILTIIRDVSERKTMEKVLLNAIIETEERERRRLAGDLHDEMGPILASLRMYISILQQKNKESEYSEILGIMSNLTKNSIENIRTISNNISPHLIERYGLVSAINAEVDNLRLLLPISIDTNLTGIKLSRNVEITYYRIIKELINNTIKYAKAKSASIYLYFENEYLSLSYSDDGIGIDLEAVEQEKNKGLGLFNIVNRIKSIDGEFSYNTSYGKGFNFTLKTKTTLR
jgi:signal transduction histidine kinase